MNAGDPTAVWEWDPGEDSFAPVVDPPERTGAGMAPLVADSWLVTDGAARAFSHHRRRFTRACRGAIGVVADAKLIAPVEEDRFWSSLAALIPASGDWFPRVELTDALRLRVRPAPARGPSVIVWDPQATDPREHPRVKGPDLPQLGALREEARSFGAGEVLLIDSEGNVVEAANSNILWWEGQTLCAPHTDSPVFGGITAGLVVEEARHRGIAVQARRITRSRLQEHEVWLTNALHGIRSVSAWRGTGIATEAGAVDEARLEEWRSWWDGLGEPLNG